MSLVGWIRCVRGKHDWNPVARYCLTANVCRYCGAPKDPVMDPLRLSVQQQMLDERMFGENDSEPFGPACVQAAKLLEQRLAQARDKQLVRH